MVEPAGPDAELVETPGDASTSSTSGERDVTIYEVGPRDGLQNEAGIVPLEAKVEFVQRLVAAGLPVVEATSFVHPKWVPQLADAAELIERSGSRGPPPPGAGAQRARPGPSARAGL